MSVEWEGSTVTANIFKKRESDKLLWKELALTYELLLLSVKVC